ncbi:MAG: hypothetical protein CSA49_07195 [Gammaproteobacteria bacterium]|nr:MAG: hypothetical protein CSA49_07195 [Gammaproteobacteria bacterium]
MSPNSKAVTKYIKGYSSLSLAAYQQLGDTLSAQRYQQAVVIPVFNETPEFIDRLQKLPATGKTLLILVVNCPAYSDPAARTHTQFFINHLHQQLTTQRIFKGAAFGQAHSMLDVLLLDITIPTPPLLNSAIKSGVGFARKVGMDVSLHLWHQGMITSPWIYNTDADAFWTSQYLTFSKQTFTSEGAIVLPFSHQQTEHSPLLSEAAACYDASLRYYVLGLRWAKSPWAYHTIGSTLLIHAESYAQTRGFPVREAGEDFYLLNKVAKTGRIYCPQEPHLQLSDRASNRVPFGTGPAVRNIANQTNNEQQFLLYHPDCFTLLKHWHCMIPALFNNELSAVRSNPVKTLINNPQEIIFRDYLWQGLSALGLNKALLHAKKQSKSTAQFSQHLWQWFDGFRTLKLIHWLREHCLASISYQQWKSCFQQQQIPFLNAASSDLSSPVDVCRHLQQLENSTLPFKGGLL